MGVFYFILIISMHLQRSHVQVTMPSSGVGLMIRMAMVYPMKTQMEMGYNSLSIYDSQVSTSMQRLDCYITGAETMIQRLVDMSKVIRLD